MLSDEKLDEIYTNAIEPLWSVGDIECAIKAGLRAVAEAAAQAERHRIYAALEADPGALWRDQGFQEWRRNREAESKD